MRFRRYLGTMYQNSENTFGKKQKQARQIYCIYFLNYEIGLPDHPVIKVDYTVSDLTTGEELSDKTEFIESLNHKSWIIQVEFLKEKRRNDLESLLSIFDQSNLTNDKHILNINEDQYPEDYRLIIRKLREACESEKVRKEMQLEDDYLSELLERDQIIAKQENALAENSKALAEKDKALKQKKEENKKNLAEKDNALAEKDNALAEKDKEIEELKRLLGK
jgi:alpha-galactosidase/6-phospho-beta-glucosidase family protein